MEWVGQTNKSYGIAHRLINAIFILILCTSFLFMTIGPIQANYIVNNHNNITGSITDPECILCHAKKENQFQPEIGQLNQLFPKKAPSFTGINPISQIDNIYTAILTFGQTPYQLGLFFDRTWNGSAYTGWQWWDGKSEFGNDFQKNLITLMILNSSDGTTKAEEGLTSPPFWPQGSYRSHSGNFSFKADTDAAPITVQNNYPDYVDLWMIKEIDLTGVSSANLNFWTWYILENEWDYGYVAVSMDGDSWTNLQGNLTTSTNPKGNNLGNGITGTSNGWVQENMDLTSFAGQRILLGFRFKSDAYVNYEGLYIDDINVTSGVTLIFSDDAEKQQPPIKTLNVNITFPHLTMINVTDPLTKNTTLLYTQRTQLVNLQEDVKHPGTYLGYFTYTPFAEQYSGNYSVIFETTINNTTVRAQNQFKTTVFGCQSCHNKKHSGYDGEGTETSFIHGESGGIESCMTVCHSGSRSFPGVYMGVPLSANPMHVHEMKFGHKGGFMSGTLYIQTPYIVPAHVSTTTCVQCHTSFIHDNIGMDTMNIANYSLNGTNLSFSTGVHENLTCENCHGSLEYPAIPQSQYELQGSLGNYKPVFTSLISFTDTYIASVNSSDDFNVTIESENSTQNILLYIIGPVDNISTGLQGPCDGKACKIQQNLSSAVNISIKSPYLGIWLIKIVQLQEGEISYTIKSTYPIQRKPIIKIPDCNSCHNSTASGGANTKYDIPDWNPGFAHSDINNDGKLDIQCRICHDAMHDITVKDCHNCHSIAPVNHPIKGLEFANYTPVQCLNCHGDPHKVTSAGGTDCIACHSKKDVNISLFGRHANINTSDGSGNVTNNDCWTCHYQKDMNRSHVYLCDSCHKNSSGIIKVNDSSLIVSTIKHGSNTCKSCHAPDMYHVKGIAGPRGRVENPGWQLISPIDNTGCLDCHLNHNGLDAPFHGPGIDPNTTSGTPKNHMAASDGPGNGSGCKGSCHNYGVHNVQKGTNSKKPTVSTPVLSPIIIVNNEPVEVTTRGSAQDGFTSIQIEVAQYRIYNSIGQTIVDWIDMNAKDGRFNSSLETVNATINTTGLPEGTYNVSVRVMASGPKSNILPYKLLPYYPLNGDWSNPINATFVIKQSRFINGTVRNTTGSAIPGADIIAKNLISGVTYPAVTNDTGFYSLSLSNGTYDLIVSKYPEYYINDTITSVDMESVTTETRDFIMTIKPIGTISGVVKKV